MIAQFVRGVRGHEQLIIRNYLFIKNVTIGKRTHWKCALYDRGACRSRCIVQDTGHFILSRPHGHAPLLDKIQNLAILYQQTLIRLPPYGSFFKEND